MLREILAKIQSTSKCFNSDAGAAGADVVVEGAKVEEVKTEAPVEINSDTGTESPVEDKGTFDDISSYIGSEKVNPEKRPLKNFKKDGMTKEQIDKLIEVSGSEIFLSDEDLANSEKSGKNTEKEEVADDKTEKTEEEPAEDLEIKEFLSKIEISLDEFNALPKKVQEKLVNTNFEQDNSELIKLKEDHDKLKDSLKTLNDDPYIAAAIEARLEEIRTGKKLMADSLPEITDKEVDDLDALLASADKTAAKKLINSIIEKRAADAVEKERSVYAAKVERRELERDATKIFSEVGKIDKRLATNIKSENWADVDVSCEKGAMIIVDYCKNNNISLAQVKKFGPEKLYKLIAIEQGWDKERDANIAKSSREELLKKLRNPEKAKTILQGGSSRAPVSKKDSTGVNREELIEQISNRNPSNYNRLLDLYDGNPQMLATLNEIRVEGEKRYRERVK